jgi:hypothetical protein
MKPGFYPVLGKGDYIKIHNRKIPIWELLEYQPVGWLYSLATKAEIVPDSPIIHDCGAFNYRDRYFPTLKGKYVDAHWAIHRYKERSKVGDIIVCPDHLLIGENPKERQEYNFNQAETFIKLAKNYLPGRVPLAVIHGLSLSDRLEVAKYFLELGYRHLGIGGLVSQAREYSTNLHIIRTIAQLVRLRSVFEEELHGTSSHLHVFGLCSPQYAKAFIQMGLSFDGSSFIRFGVGGGMFASHEEKLIRIPAHLTSKCSCHVCRVLHRHGIDPWFRNKGRNYTMGRVAHNLNQAIATYKRFTPKEKVYLVAGCSKQLTYPAAARDLYCSQHFQACRRYVEKQKSQ